MELIGKIGKGLFKFTTDLRLGDDSRGDPALCEMLDRRLCPEIAEFVPNQRSLGPETDNWATGQ